ncbi:MAG: hypothetical protein KAT37_01865 [Candidatus Aenigmarchaeota archaeon]|nr:hypothetical protein [Candidatus Aenigmarchaeota archaeon]
MKKINLVLLLISVLVVLVLTFLFSMLLPSSPVDIKTVENLTFESSENFMLKEERWFYPLKGMVVEMKNDTIPIGIAGQTYELDFGRIPHNSSVRKIINMKSDNFAKVELYTSGNISSHILLPENFYMKGQEEKITITFNGTDLGNFTGTLLIKNVIPKNILAEEIIKLI